MSAQDATNDIINYKIISKIGEGGFSTVYRVQNKSTKKYYAAKVSNNMIDEDTKDDPETLSIFREVNLMSLLNHPSVLKFIGYYPTNFEEDPLPTIITEFAMNGSLRDIINMETQGLSPDDWNPTKKLINIYGIASGMSYLHANNILHRDLKPENILINDYLHPKISDFGLSKITSYLSMSMNIQSQKGPKGTPAYIAPEVFELNESSKLSDVYAFGFIVYEIMTCEEPFKNYNIYKLMVNVVKEGFRPTIPEDVPTVYSNLIERCWSHESKERPHFDQIVEELKTNRDFITNLVDESEFYDYVDFIDKYHSTFDVSKGTIHFSEFIKKQGRNKNVKPIIFNDSISDDSSYYKSINDVMNIQQGESQTNEREIGTESKSKEEKLTSNHNKSKSTDNLIKTIESDEKQQKIQENIENEINTTKNDETEQSIAQNLMYPLREFNDLSKFNQKLVEEAEEDTEKEFEVGRFLMEGENDFPHNIKLGLQYIDRAIEHKNINAIIYYITLLIKGKHIKEDHQKASEYLAKLNTTNYSRKYFLNGLLSYKKNKFKEAFNYYKEGKKFGDSMCIYKYCKMLFIGEGTKKNVEESIKNLIDSKNQGHKRSEHFLESFNSLNNNKKFCKLQPETQLIFITNNIKNIENKEMNGINGKKEEKKIDVQFDRIIFRPKKTEKLFFNKSLKSTTFYSILNQYQDISIEIEYTSASFKSIADLIFKIRNKNIYQLQIGIVFTSFSKPFTEKCFSKEISYQKINSSIKIIPSEAFKSCPLLKQITIPSSVTEIGSHAFSECSSLTRITIPSSVTEIGSSTFSGCSSLMQITIPSSVTEIGSHAFSECSSLTQITIPSSVTVIGSSTFSGCSSLAQITIPSSVTEFGYNIFNGVESLDIKGDIKFIPDKFFGECSSLTQITIPSSVTEIGSSAFAECSSLTQITISSSVIEIREGAFSGCSSLTQIIFEIPSSVTSIGSSAFSGCSSLAQITIPSSVTSIGNHAFSGCSSLAHITIPSSVTEFGYNIFNGVKSLDIKGDIKFIPDRIFGRCSSLVQITIPSSVTEIGSFAFFKYLSLAQITIPSSVTSIGSFAFSKCLSLAQITIPSSIIKIGNHAFSECSALTQITIPSSVTEFGYNIFNGVKSLDIKGDIKFIPDRIFGECSSLTQITIPSSVTSIGEDAFSGCSSLTKITIPSSITVIGEDAFSGCSSLTQITIPSSVSEIGGGIFNGCMKLNKISFFYKKEIHFKYYKKKFILGKTNSSSKKFKILISVIPNIDAITIPQFIKQIGSYAFAKCSLLKQITIPLSVSEIGYCAFSKCSSLTQITIPSSVTKIGYSAFSGCSSLTQIIIPSSVTYIGFDAFSKCSSLTQIIIPSPVAKIDYSTFSECSSLTQITIPSSVTYIGFYAFAGCSSLTQIIIPSSVTEIGYYAFFKCSSLTQITIPSSVTEIREGAFSGCSSLTQISIPSSVISIGSSAFSGCSSLTQMSIPSYIDIFNIGLDSSVEIIIIDI